MSPVPLKQIHFVDQTWLVAAAAVAAAVAVVAAVAVAQMVTAEEMNQLVAADCWG